MFIFGSASMLLLFSSLFGLWTIGTRTDYYYSMPFGYQVPWFWAGDLFVSMGLGSMVIVWYILLWRGRKK